MLASAPDGRGSTMAAEAVSCEIEIPEWLFDESYHHVGDVAETIALLSLLPLLVVATGLLDAVQG